MAPIKFDDNIKDKLEKRTLQPSSDAWNQLSAQLDAHDKKNSRSWVFYIGIAASIVGVLLVTTLFFKTSEESSVSPTVVDTEINTTSDKTESIIANETNNDSKVIDTNKEIININQDTKKDVSPIASSIKNEPKVATISEEKTTKKGIEKQPLPIIETKDAVASSKNVAKDKKEVMSLHDLDFEKAKVIEVVAKIKSLEAEGNMASEAEIEDLLKAAEKDILRQRIYNETTRTVDADALLQDVEEDLEQSFRTRVFESLKSSYKTVKTAVAERNN